MPGMYDKGPVLGAAPSVHRSNIKPGWCEHVPKDVDWPRGLGLPSGAGCSTGDVP